MKLLLNKEAIQSNIWGSAVGYFNRVIGECEILPKEGDAPEQRWFHKLQYLLEVKFAGSINDNSSIFDKRCDVSTENIVLNLSCLDMDTILNDYPQYEVWAFEYQGRNVSFHEIGGIGFSELTSLSER